VGVSLFTALRVFLKKNYRERIENHGGEDESLKRKDDCISLGIVIYGSQSQQMILWIKKGLQS